MKKGMKLTPLPPLALDDLHPKGGCWYLSLTLLFLYCKFWGQNFIQVWGEGIVFAATDCCDIVAALVCCHLMLLVLIAACDWLD